MTTKSGAPDSTRHDSKQGRVNKSIAEKGQSTIVVEMTDLKSKSGETKVKNISYDYCIVLKIQIKYCRWWEKNI